jgi:hypothetical protein
MGWRVGSLLNHQNPRGERPGWKIKVEIMIPTGNLIIKKPNLYRLINRSLVKRIVVVVLFKSE